MYNPQDVFNEDGLLEYKVHLYQLRKALFFIINNADDLHIGHSDRGENLMDMIYRLDSELESDFLDKGDGEENE